MKISTAGIYEVSATEYHADPCPEPSLSASIATVLLADSPAHARHQHPRLNPFFHREEREMFDLGSAAHAYLLEGSSGFAIIDAPDWRTKAAKEERDAARTEGRLPILRHKWDDILAMVEAVNRQLDDFRDLPRPFSDGKPEQTLVWKEGAVWCRARLDWLSNDHEVICDLKTPGASANPDQWTRQMFAGPDLQAAFYLRGVKTVTGKNATLRFIVSENYTPYALSVISLGPPALVIAEKKVRLAIELWTQCIESGQWPGYPTRTCYADLPPWEEARWLQREEREIVDPTVNARGAFILGGRK